MSTKDTIDKLNDIKDALGWKNIDDKDTMEFVIQEVMNLIDVIRTDLIAVGDKGKRTN